MRTPFSKLVSMAALTLGIAASAHAQTITTVIEFPNTALGITANPVTNTIYAVAPSVAGPTDDLAVISGSTDTLTTNIPVTTGASFTAVNYFSNTVYVAGCNYTLDPEPCTVTVINGKTNAVTATIPVTTTPGLGLTGIAVNPFNGMVYVANGSDNVIDIINGFKNKLVGTITLNGNSPAAIAVNPFLDRLYVPFGNNLTAVINACTKKIVSTTTFGASTVGVAVNLLSGNVFVTDDEQGPSMTGALNAKGKLLASVTVDDTPLGVDVDPFTDLVFVASTALDTVDVINGATNTLVATVNNVPADYIAVNFATEKVYVAGPLGVTVLTEK